MSAPAESVLGRRSFLTGSIAAAATIGTMPTNAATLVPEVDQLSLQIIVDNATFGPFLPDLKRPGLHVVRHAGEVGRATMPGAVLQGEFGLSILATSLREGARAKVLIDFGYTAGAARNNLVLLGVDVSDLDAAVLSHGHLDHYGGFPGFSEALTGRRVPLYVGGEETFCERLVMIGNPPRVMGRLDRDALARAGFDVQIVGAPKMVKQQAFTTGVIPLSTWERAAIPTQMRPGQGCDRTRLSTIKREHDQLPDDGEHELATCYLVKGLGLVIIASCSHRGVINSIRQAQQISGIDKVHAVVGGFHLVRPRTEDEARRTVAEFKTIDPTYIVPMHCSGDVFINEAMSVMPEKIIRSYVGTELIFGA